MKIKKMKKKEILKVIPESYMLCLVLLALKVAISVFSMKLCGCIFEKKNLNSSKNTLPLFGIRTFLDLLYVFTEWNYMQLKRGCNVYDYD